MVKSKLKTSGIDRSYHPSVAQKMTFILGHLAIVLFGAWIVYFEGWTLLGESFGENWNLVDSVRAQILFAAAVIYWFRHMFTLFYMLERKVEWAEVFGLLVFIALFEIGLIILGGGALRNYPIKLGWWDGIALVLFLLGSFLNSFSELQRKQWKQDPANRGQCYTEGLFSISMHINYFGDSILFTGWCIFTASYWSLALPIVMTWMFIAVHIPGLDKHLAKRYGEAFQVYSEKTRKFIPWVY